MQVYHGIPPYIPPGVVQGAVSEFPVLYFLPGRGGRPTAPSASMYQRYAADYKSVVVVPDSTPRNTGLPVWDRSNAYGEGASMHLDAMTPGWKDHFNMFTYVTEELVDVVERNFDFVLAGKRSIMGQSMGGHGSLLCALKKPGFYKSVSGSAPMCPAELMKAYQGPSLDMLVHVGSLDHFWPELKLWELVKAAHGKDNINLDVKVKGGYNHSYYFVRSVMEEVIKFHASFLLDK